MEVIIQEEWSTYNYAATLAAIMNGLFSTQSQRSASVAGDAYRRYISQCFIRTGRGEEIYCKELGYVIVWAG